jgi:hypothetical protein
MLRPSKHSHPDRTLISVALVLLGRLKAHRVDEYAALKAYSKKMVPGGDALFLPALNFLFLLGLVSYRPKIDSIEYLGPQ